MVPQMLEIKYECQHKSCYVNCREGIICLEEELFNQLSAAFPEEGIFRSPKGACRMGFSQPFKVLRMQRLGEGPIEDAPSALDPSDNPLLILVEEHKAINRSLEKVEEHIKKRDLDALWVSTKELENDLVLHSGIKEEEVLFGMSKGLLPFGETLVDIIKEEHREIISLLHNFREALEINELNDGIIDSVIVSLRGHIRKEDQEFFEIVDKCLNDEIRPKITLAMREVESKFVREEAGARKMNPKRAAIQAQYDEQVSVVREAGCDTCCNH
ncbi:MAG: hemerythrin domain-containing protein [Deltaproteobacteria bacterium]|nr:hemerythrin domain-containing protein [Deltaproteobacteria bacterium]MBZ0220570.1 hemerythrin domain-containing protein [Deltaproteobacteria bacterium]